MCAIPSTAVFCSESIVFFPVWLQSYSLNLLLQFRYDRNNHTLYIPHLLYLLYLNSCIFASILLLLFLMTFLSAGTATSTRTAVLCFLFSAILCSLFTITSLCKPYCYLLKFTWSKNPLFTFRNFRPPCADCRLTTTETLQRLKMVPSVAAVCLLVPSKRSQSLSH